MNHSLLQDITVFLYINCTGTVKVRNCGFGPHADQTNDMVCISHKRSHFLNYEKKSDSEAVKKGERSVNQIENKGEDLYPLGDGIV